MSALRSHRFLNGSWGAWCWLGRCGVGGAVAAALRSAELLAVGTVTALPDGDLLQAALTTNSGRRVNVSNQVRGQRARWRDLARENAQSSLQAYLADKQNVYARFVALQDALGLEDMPARLECFDISHTGGEATVASCVVFNTDGPLKSDYRRFNIEGVAPGDDYGAMHQALSRRYARLKAGEGQLPDILVIDGGMGTQLEKSGVPILHPRRGRSPATATAARLCTRWK